MLFPASTHRSERVRMGAKPLAAKEIRSSSKFTLHYEESGFIARGSGQAPGHQRTSTMRRCETGVAPDGALTTKPRHVVVTGWIGLRCRSAPTR